MLASLGHSVSASCLEHELHLFSEPALLKKVWAVSQTLPGLPIVAVEGRLMALLRGNKYLHFSEQAFRSSGFHLLNWLLTVPLPAVVYHRYAPSLWVLHESVTLSWPYMWQLFFPLQARPGVWQHYFMMQP